MKKLKKSLPLVLVGLLIIAVASSFFSSGKSRTSYSGEDLYKGIFFQQGDVAHQIRSYDKQVSMLEAMPEKEKKALAELSEQTIQQLKAKDPEFFEKFQDVIESKDCKAIKSLLNQSARQTIDILKENPQCKESFASIDEVVKSKQFKMADDKEKIGLISLAVQKKSSYKPNSLTEEAIAYPIFVWAAAVWEVAAAVNYAAVVNAAAAVNAAAVVTVYAYVYAEYKYWPSEASNTQKSPFQEKLIYEISSLA